MKAGWKTVKLADVAEMRPPKSEAKLKGLKPTDEVGFLPMEDLTQFQKHAKALKTRTMSEVSNSYTYFADGDVLMAKISPCFQNGKMGIATGLPNGVGYGSSEYFVFRPSKELSAEWLFYYLQDPSFRRHATGKFSGNVGQQRLPKELIEELEIPLPPLAEQKRIVALLDEAFAGIDTLSSNAKTRSSEALCVFEQERDSFFANPDNKYTETTVSDITTRLQYGTSEKSASTGRYVVLRMGNIQDGEIDYEDLKYTSSQEVIDQYALKPGDVLFNRTNSPQWVGKSAIYRGEMPAVFAGYNIKIHTIADKINSEFLTFFLNSDRAMSFGRSTFISSVNQANINAEKLRSYRLPLPPLREQKAIADRLGQIRKMSRALAAIYQNSLAQSEHLKAAILRSAFNGTL